MFERTVLAAVNRIPSDALRIPMGEPYADIFTCLELRTGYFCLCRFETHSFSEWTLRCGVFHKFDSFLEDKVSNPPGTRSLDAVTLGSLSLLLFVCCILFLSTARALRDFGYLILPLQAPLDRYYFCRTREIQNLTRIHLCEIWLISRFYSGKPLSYSYRVNASLRRVYRSLVRKLADPNVVVPFVAVD
jgi:hypothetical protein